MIKLENFEVMGWEHVIRGMRNPMNSWDKSDSYFGCEDIDGLDKKHTVYEAGCYRKSCDDCAHKNQESCLPEYTNYGVPAIGPNDLDLMRRLRNAGTDHRKFMRMITVYVDITAPLYWWKEFDAYKVGTVVNSCSTMHKIHAKEFTLEDFSCEHLFDDWNGDHNDGFVYHDTGILGEEINHATYIEPYSQKQVLELMIEALNVNRESFLETKDKKFWWQMIQLLPSSYNQKRTVMLNYEVLANIYKSRKAHKLDEWRELCKWIEEELPYPEIITGGNKTGEEKSEC